MKRQIQQNNDNKKEITFQLMLPLDVGIKIEADASVHTLLEITERMDYSRLNATKRNLQTTIKPSKAETAFQKPTVTPSLWG